MITLERFHDLLCELGFYLTLLIRHIVQLVSLQIKRQNTQQSIVHHSTIRLLIHSLLEIL